MFLARQSVKRRLAVGLGLYLILASIGPSVAIACEGGGEENASLTPITWSGGGGCPLKGAAVYFSVLNKWCEYGLKNNNAVEKIKIKSGELNLKSKECEEKTCVGFIKGVEAGQTECSTGLKLDAGKSCRVRIEYQKKPVNPVEIGYDQGLESEPSGRKFFVEKFQFVE